MAKENKEWIGHQIREYVETQFKKGEEAIIDFKDGSAYLLMVNVLEKLGYQFSTSSIPFGTKFTIDNKVSLESQLRRKYQLTKI